MRLPNKYNNSCKLLEKEIEEIKDLYSKGWNLTSLAHKFNVNYNTIKYWVNEDFRENLKKNSRKRSAWLLVEHPEVKKKQDTSKHNKMVQMSKIIWELENENENLKRQLKEFRKENDSLR